MSEIDPRSLSSLLLPYGDVVLRLQPTNQARQQVRDWLARVGAIVAWVDSDQPSEKPPSTWGTPLEHALWAEMRDKFELTEAHAWNWNAFEEGLLLLEPTRDAPLVVVLAAARRFEREDPKAFDIALSVLTNASSKLADRGVVLKVILI